MQDLAVRALNLAQARGASYADIPIVEFETQRAAVKNANVEGICLDTNQGLGARVIYDGAWALASSSRLEAVAGRLLAGT